MTDRLTPSHDAEIDRSAFNASFHEIGLPWHWDADTYRALAVNACDRARLRTYIERQHPHLLALYDAETLAEAVLQIKDRCRRAMAGCTPRTLPHFDWTDARRGQVGI